jgi:hypothetical protein
MVMKGISSEMPFLFVPTVNAERFHPSSDLSDTSEGNHTKECCTQLRHRAQAYPGDRSRKTQAQLCGKAIARSKPARRIMGQHCA